MEAGPLPVITAISQGRLTKEDLSFPPTSCYSSRNQPNPSSYPLFTLSSLDFPFINLLFQFTFPPDPFLAIST